MQDDRFLIETTCLGDRVRSYIDPHTLEGSSGATLEMGDGKGNWWPVGTVDNVEGLGPAEPARVVVTGATAEQRKALHNYSDADIIFIDEFADADVKTLDMIDCKVSGSFVVSDKDQKKLTELFERFQTPAAHSVKEAASEALALHSKWLEGKPRGKGKRKRKKDWQR